MSLEVIILAAGKGTRMRSDLPKVLHPLAGRALILHVLDCARAIGADRISIVYGHGGDAVPATVGDDAIHWVFQGEQKGTGHAVQLALPDSDANTTVLVMYGDIPMIRPETLATLAKTAEDHQALSILTTQLEEPAVYGRIIRDAEDRVTGIVEARDATPEQLLVKEINTGFIAAPLSLLSGWVARLDNDNSQGELYLTSVAAMAVADGQDVKTQSTDNPWEVQGVNSQQELSLLERHYQLQKAHQLLESGVMIADPARIDIRGFFQAGTDCFVDINLVAEGTVTLGNHVTIGPNCVLTDVEVGDYVQIKANSVMEGARIGDHCSVGPFARVRSGTILEQGARLGNFVETKEAHVGPGSKINHLSYIGDSEIGRDVNIGAGVITCNYDGVNKSRTVIGDHAFVGSDCQLVAPVSIGKGATVGAGTTLTRDAPEAQLTVSRNPQKSYREWRRPKKKPV